MKRPTSTTLKKYLLAWLLLAPLVLPAPAQAQMMAHAPAVPTGQIKGKIVTTDGSPVEFVNVMLKKTGKGSISAADGSFTIRNVKAGSYTLVATYVGLEAQEREVTVVAGQATQLELELPKSDQALSEVLVTERKSANVRPVAAGKIAIAPMDLPQSVAVVSSQVIRDQQASRLSEVIRNVNGVSLGTTRGSTAETFFARGYNLGANNILKNGARSNSAAMPEASTLEKVEVLKGSAALLYGNVSGGAVINMVTKQPKFEYGGEASLRLGSYNLFKPLADVYGPITPNLAFRLIGTYESADSYRDQVSSQRTYVNPSLLYKIGSKTALLVQADYLDHDFMPDFGIGSLDGKIPTSIARSTFFNTPWAYNKVNQRTASVNLNHQLNEKWKLNVVAAQQLFRRDYFSTERIQALANGNWGRKLTRSKIGEDYYNGQVNLNGEFNTGRIGHTLLVGADAERYLNITNGFHIASLINKDGVYDTINILDPQKFLARTDEPLASNISRTETPTYRFGTYAQDLISISDKVKVLAGLRWSYQKVAVAKVYDLTKDVVSNSATATTRYDRAFSPRLGLVYQPTQTTSLFASYSNNFSPNTGKDVYEQNLGASIIDQYEAGVKNELLKGRLSANLTLYKIVNNNLAQMAQFKADGVTVNTDANIKEFTGQTTSDGAEIDLDGTLLPGLNFMAGYSYNFMRYTKTSGLKGSYREGERLVSNPAHTANASFFYTFQQQALKNFRIGLSGFYTGKRNAGWNNTYQQTQPGSRLIPVTGFATVDLSLGYAYKKLSLLTKLSNLTNELNYYVHENYSVNPIAPRQFVSTLAYRF
ncbi:MAG: TonB-dependent siderophore receptor [Adhaeribacter sp.]